MVDRFGLDPTLKPTVQDIAPTYKKIGYRPRYSLKNLLKELEEHGEKGPPVSYISKEY